MIHRLYSFYHLYDLQIIQRKFGYIFSRTVGKKKANKPVIPYADRNLATFRFIQCSEHPSKSSWKISNNVPDSSVGCRDRYNKPGRIERGETAERLIRGGGGARVKTYRLYSPRFVSRQLTDL